MDRPTVSGEKPRLNPKVKKIPESCRDDAGEKWLNKQEKKKTKGKTKKRRKSKSQKAAGKFLSSWEWTELRYKVLLKYGRKCMCCGATPDDGARICVDHIKPRHKHPELKLDESNLQVLCNTCNRGKGAWDETDFRKR